MNFTFNQKIDNATELLNKSAEKLGYTLIQKSGYKDFTPYSHLDYV